ncbi:MAG TPA: GntR family transcriptional regulator [Vicinamibacteria bacterium]|nr:GntR family transcriptional regulator [Vicinamibacteria bacterium]
MTLLFAPNPSSGVPVYLQLMEQVKHAIETGALREGEQLPATRKVAEDLVMNANTVAKAYRELVHEGVIELRKGLGVFVARNRQAGGDLVQRAQPLLRRAIDRMVEIGLEEEQMRRLFESEVTRLRRAARVE